MSRFSITVDRDIYLRPWHMDDVEPLAKIANNRKISVNLRDAFPYPYQKQHAIEFISLSLAGESKNTMLAVIYNGNIAGGIGYHRQTDVNRLSAEIGYYIAEEFWNKGIATKCVRALTGYIFENTDIVRIFALPFEWNIASCRVLEKAGFSLEAIMKKAVIKENIIGNQCLYALIK